MFVWLSIVNKQIVTYIFGFLIDVIHFRDVGDVEVRKYQGNL